MKTRFATDARNDLLDIAEYIAAGHLDGRMVVTVWTPRAGTRRIISLRKANEREQAAYGPRLD